ncbi:MAG: hypothetical protein VX768_01510 [Planctomycetota bacterium]|nr:hypothetical protein [Planctomycetota bacterium]
MNTIQPLALLAVLSVSFQFTQQAKASDPQDVFSRGARQIVSITERHENATSDVTSRCLPRIRRLLKSGNYNEARTTADRCITELGEILDSARTALRTTCERCIDALVQMGAPDLARDIHDLCVRASSRMKDVHDRAVNAIQDLF